MAYHIIGLDRGTCLVKAVILEKSFRGYEVVGTRQVPVPQDGSRAPNEEAVQAAVSQLVDEFNPASVSYVTSVPGSAVSSWFIELPFTDQKRIDQTIRFEIENYVPFDLEEMVFDYHLVHQSDGKSRVACGLVPKAFVRDLLARLKILRVDPQALLSPGHAASVIPPGRGDERRALAIIDLGHTQTTVTIKLHGAPDFIRTIPRGGLEITQALMKRFGVNYRTAELMKEKLEPVAPIADEETQAFYPSYDPEVTQAQMEPSSLVRQNLADLAPVSEPVNAHPDAPEGESPASAGVPDAGDGFLPAAPERSSVAEVGGQRIETIEAAETIEAGSADDGDELDDEAAQVTTSGLMVPVEEGSGSRTDGGRDEEWFSAKDIEETGGGSGHLERTMRSLPASFEAEDEVTPVGGAVQSPEAIRRVVEETMTSILVEVRNALIAYEGERGEEIHALMLVGGGALMKGLPEMMEESFGVEAGVPTRLGPEQDSLPPEKEVPRYGPAFALAWLGVTEAAKGSMDFRRGEFAYEQRNQRLYRWLLAGLAVLAVALIWAGMSFLGEVRTLTKKSKQLDDTIAQTIKTYFPELNIDPKQGTEHALALIMEEQLRLKERGKLLGLDASERKVLDVLKEISNAVPTRDEVVLNVDLFQLEGNQLKLKGTTDTFDDVGHIEKGIQKSPMVSEVTKEVGSKGTKKQFTFTVTLADSEEDML